MGRQYSVNIGLKSDDENNSMLRFTASYSNVIPYKTKAKLRLFNAVQKLFAAVHIQIKFGHDFGEHRGV